MINCWYNYRDDSKTSVRPRPCNHRTYSAKKFLFGKFLLGRKVLIWPKSSYWTRFNRTQKFLLGVFLSSALPNLFDLEILANQRVSGSTWACSYWTHPLYIFNWIIFVPEKIKNSTSKVNEIKKSLQDNLEFLKSCAFRVRSRFASERFESSLKS